MLFRSFQKEIQREVSENESNRLGHERSDIAANIKKRVAVNKKRGDPAEAGLDLLNEEDDGNPDQQGDGKLQRQEIIP